ncbi:hypothetical protein Pint_06474 [Pistacia integerrima]|uniref:Uncharacterized protein n=2 Tax=Pistacia integerrima TaxID=434235 RepID=A0ACC0Z3B8_9ROSI|nr:hypothetical protein Pint_06473 [Pistacia integerrima]KAJ0045402.1 hypothetical protein Pint_06474 [Pistacia integerrima]
MFNNSLNLHNFVKSALPEQAGEVVDYTLLQEGGEIILECLSKILENTVACSAEVPRERMKIDDVESGLRLMKKKLVETRIHEEHTINIPFN